MRKIIAFLLMAMLVTTIGGYAMAEEPDFASMNSSEWFEYEFFMD